MSFDAAHCTLCPRRCGADREKGVGLCHCGTEIRIARAALHPWEEPCISGRHGSGTVFFSGCALGCVFCQNRKISRQAVGKAVTVTQLAEIFLKLQEQQAHNINLVTGSHGSCRLWNWQNPSCTFRWCGTAAAMNRRKSCTCWRGWWTSTSLI